MGRIVKLYHMLVGNHLGIVDRIGEVVYGAEGVGTSLKSCRHSSLGLVRKTFVALRISLSRCSPLTQAKDTILASLFLQSNYKRGGSNFRQSLSKPSIVCYDGVETTEEGGSWQWQLWTSRRIIASTSSVKHCNLPGPLAETI